MNNMVENPQIKELKGRLNGETFRSTISGLGMSGGIIGGLDLIIKGVEQHDALSAAIGVFGVAFGVTNLKNFFFSMRLLNKTITEIEKIK